MEENHHKEIPILYHIHRFNLNTKKDTDKPKHLPHNLREEIVAIITNVKPPTKKTSF